MTSSLPDVLAARDVPADTEEVDVVVVGFGMAGGCAALQRATGQDGSPTRCTTT